jgi:large subunit ribosomal protein L15
MAQDVRQLSLDKLQAIPGARKERVRVGRGIGSGLGKTSGRGGKGQTARSGKGRPRGFEGGQTPLQRRLPKYGFKNPFRKVYTVVNLSSLEKSFNAGDTVDATTLVAKGLLKNTNSLIKVLGDGSLTKKLVVKAHRFSRSAAQKINQAGGEAVELGEAANANAQEK